ncbi:hypothetical protein M407DRAFT_243553 [Tulasnella calospora MUT 4182]|uniref:WW domain-containing protein n=1 Tax=Tulasnella calospora MUT 4182 TaxID=1051891 RepID=A0A0C3Q9R2_9AGAM|nr:hypothetical protein M407DRAFT_243553 [Tulasnella calospora MUT 4182]
MLSSPTGKATLPTYSESQALAGSADVHHPTNVDEIEEEEDLRPLPSGWIRQWDSRTENYFYVDTTANPPLSVWEHPEDLIEEQHNPPVASSSRPIQKPEVEARATWQDAHRTATPNQHTSLLDRPAFTFPARRRKCYGPIGLLVRLIFDHYSGSGSGHPSTSRVYAPPAYPVTRCGQRRAERRARRLERRDQIRAWSAAKWPSERPKDGSGFQKRGGCSRSRC